MYGIFFNLKVVILNRLQIALNKKIIYVPDSTLNSVI